MRLLRVVTGAVLDVLDAAGDAVAEAAGLRARSS